MRTPSLFLGVAMLLMAPWSASAEDRTSPNQRIRAVALAIDKAVSRGDADGYVADAADDAIFMPPDEPALVGRDAIRAWARGVFGSLRLEMKHVPEDITITDGFAYMHGRAVGTVTLNGGGAPVSFENKFVWVLRRGARDRWQILRVIWNSNTPGN